MTQQNLEGRFTDEKIVEAWLYDKASANTNARMNIRYHREGWCSSDQPYGTRVALVRPVEGNPNDFICQRCGLHFRRVVAPEDVATQLKQVDAGNFNGSNAASNVGELPVATKLMGCDCVTGYEHAQRGDHPAPVTGNTPRGQEVVPMVFGTFTVTVTRKEAETPPAAPTSERSSDSPRRFIEDDYVNPWALGGDLG